MLMKKFVVIIALLLCTSLSSSAQISLCAYFDGYWSEWIPATNVGIYGNYEGFIIHPTADGKWDYPFKFTIHNFNVPNKKQRKKDIKSNKWYTFTGTVEYYISDDIPSALYAFREKRGPFFVKAKQANGRPTKKITSRATIKVAAFKDVPTVYNIHYDNVGLGISLNSVRFERKVEYK